MWELVKRLGFDEHIRKILKSMYRNFCEDMEMKFGLDKCKVMIINEKEEGENKDKQLQILGKYIKKSRYI